MNNVDYLRQAESRLSSLQINTPDSPELARFRDVIIPDIKSKFTAADQAEYAALKAGKTREQIAADAAAEIRRMNENKDKPSI